MSAWQGEGSSEVVAQPSIWPAVGGVLLAFVKLTVTVLLPFVYLALRVWIEFMSWVIAISVGLVVGMLAAILGVRTPRVLFVYHLGGRR